MIAILGTTTYLHSPLHLRLKSGVKLNNQPVRLKRSQTLDAGAVLVNTGFTASDKTLTLPCDMTRAEHEALLDLLANETLFTLSCDAGFYTGAISNVSQNDGITITFLVCDDVHAAPPSQPYGGVDYNTDWAMIGFNSGGWTTYDEAFSAWNNSGASATFMALGYTSTRGPYYTGLRFSSLSLPAEAIEKAQLYITSNAYSDSGMEVEIAVQNSTNAGYPSSGTDLISLDCYPITLNWQITDDWTSGGTVYSPDFSAVLNQVLTADGYVAGNAVMVLLKTKYNTGSVYRAGQSGSSIYLMLNN